MPIGELVAVCVEVVEEVVVGVAEVYVEVEVRDRVALAVAATEARELTTSSL